MSTSTISTMSERDLQNYLFDNPDVLFPNQTIRKKRREVFIDGRRIDLLFYVEGIQYIVELKRDTIRREDIGQIFEYYGLMRRSNSTANFRMILVAPSIPDYRRLPLEEFGIRCVEVSHKPVSGQETAELREASATQIKRECEKPDTASPPLQIKQLTFEDLLPPVNPLSMQISHDLLRDALPDIQEAYFEYEIRPVKMVKPNQPDVLCIPPECGESKNMFVGAGAWWAYSFGHSDVMPKNDLPNVSVNALPWGLDFSVNAELKTSQAVVQSCVSREPARFNRLVSEHGKLWLQTWLKLEFQPRFYFWILLPQHRPGTWQAKTILDVYAQSKHDFESIRAYWLESIKSQYGKLTPAQSLHMDRSNKSPNLAIRMVRTYAKQDEAWNYSYDAQKEDFRGEYRKLKPLVAFFQ